MSTLQAKHRYMVRLHGGGQAWFAIYYQLGRVTI